MLFGVRGYAYSCLDSDSDLIGVHVLMEFAFFCGKIINFRLTFFWAFCSSAISPQSARLRLRRIMVSINVLTLLKLNFLCKIHGE